MSNPLQEQFNLIEESSLFQKIVAEFRIKMNIPKLGFISQEQEDLLMTDKKHDKQRMELWEDFINTVKSQYNVSQALEFKISDYLFFGKNLILDTAPYFKGCSIMPGKNNTVIVTINSEATQKDVINAIKGEWSWIEIIIRQKNIEAGLGFKPLLVREKFKRKIHEEILTLHNNRIIKSDGSIDKLKAIKHFEGLGEKVDQALPDFKNLFFDYYQIDIKKKAGIRQAINRLKHR